MFEKVSSEIKEYLLTKFPHDITDIGMEQSIIQTGLVDSISLVMVILFLEERFSINFNEKDLLPDYFDTISGMSNLVIRKINNMRSERNGLDYEI